MKKLSIALILTLCLALGLSGCGAQIVSASIQPEATLAQGETLVLTAHYEAEGEASDEALAKAAASLSPVWASSDETVATVDADGTIHAVGAGEATVTLTAKEGVSAQCRVTVYVPLESLRAPEELTLALNADETAALEVTLDPAEGGDVAFAYESDDETVATVDAHGLVRAVGAGECNIKTRAVCTTGAGEITKELETAVTVQRAPKKLSASDMTHAVGETAAPEIDFGLAEGETADIGTDFSYASADEKIAAVDKNGVVTGMAAGETAITAVNELGQSCEFKVKVAEADQPAMTARPTGSTGSAGQGAGSGGNSGTSGGGSNGSTGGTTAATPAPQPTPQPGSTPEPTPQPTPEPEPTPQPTPQPEPTPQPTPQPEPTPQPTPQPEPQPEQFPCYDCGNTFNTYEAFVAHYNNPAYHAPKVAHYHCNCSACFSTMDHEALMAHMYQHAINGEPYSYSTTYE